MTRPKLKRKLPDSTDEKLRAFTHGIIGGLTDNPYFSDAAERLNPVKEKLKIYEDAIPAPYERSKVLTTIKLLKKQDLIDALHSLLLYVEYRADFDIEVLQSSNFELIGKRQPKGTVGQVSGIEFKTNGEEGLLFVQCKHDPNATIYKARVATEKNDWRKFGANNSRTVAVQGLPVGETLYVQMRIENGHSKSPWSVTMTAEIPGGDTVLRKVE